MSLIPTRFPVDSGEVFPFGAFVLDVEPSPFAAVEVDGLTITPYANNKGRIAHSIRASELRAPGVAGRGKTASKKEVGGVSVDGRSDLERARRQKDAEG